MRLLGVVNRRKNIRIRQNGKQLAQKTPGVFRKEGRVRTERWQGTLVFDPPGNVEACKLFHSLQNFLILLSAMDHIAEINIEVDTVGMLVIEQKWKQIVDPVFVFLDQPFQIRTNLTNCCGFQRRTAFASQRSKTTYRIPAAQSPSRGGGNTRDKSKTR